MSQQQRRERQALSASARRWEALLTRRLRMVLGVSVLAAITTGVWLIWEEWFPMPPERVVKVYWVHDCTCVSSWIKSLEAEGFAVKSFEQDTLKHIRLTLHMPNNLHGCHVGEYLGYFLEGHIAPAALPQLATKHPIGQGLVTQAAVTQETEHLSSVLDEQSPIVLVNGDSRTVWFIPSK